MNDFEFTHEVIGLYYSLVRRCTIDEQAFINEIGRLIELYHDVIE